MSSNSKRYFYSPTPPSTSSISAQSKHYWSPPISPVPRSAPYSHRQPATGPNHSHSSYREQAQQGSTGGYRPVAFDEPAGSTDDFYGSLIDPITGRPSEVFSRFSDALFFWMDSHCAVPGLQGTGVIEPAKYAWMTVKLGSDVTTAQILVDYLETYYQAAGVPIQYRAGPDGQLVAVLDRRGWLHASVFQMRADPDDSWKNLSKAISLFNLIDPATSHPFPTPVPRSAFPAYPTPTLQSAYTSWQTRTVMEVQRKASEAMIHDAMASARSSMSYLYQTPSMAYLSALTGAGTGAYAFGGNGGFGQGSGQGEHASVADAVSGVASLASTALSIFGGGGLGGLAGLGGLGGFSS